MPAVIQSTVARPSTSKTRRVHGGSHLLFSRELPSDNVTQNIMWKVPSWDLFVGVWVDSHDPITLVHLYRQVDEIYTSHSPSVVNSRTLIKAKARKTTRWLLMQTISSPACLLGGSSQTLALGVDSGASVCISFCREDIVTVEET